MNGQHNLSSDAEAERFGEQREREPAKDADAALTKECWEHVQKQLAGAYGSSGYGYGSSSHRYGSSGYGYGSSGYGYGSSSHRYGSSGYGYGSSAYDDY